MVEASCWLTAHPSIHLSAYSWHIHGGLPCGHGVNQTDSCCPLCWTQQFIPGPHSAFVPSPHLFSPFRGYCRCSRAGAEAGGRSMAEQRSGGPGWRADLSLVPSGSPTCQFARLKWTKNHRKPASCSFPTSTGPSPASFAAPSQHPCCRLEIFVPISRAKNLKLRDLS